MAFGRILRSFRPCMHTKPQMRLEYWQYATTTRPSRGRCSRCDDWIDWTLTQQEVDAMLWDYYEVRGKRHAGSG